MELYSEDDIVVLSNDSATDAIEKWARMRGRAKSRGP